MQDRVPLYPGRVILTPVSGQANTYDLTRADQPTQVGTPLNTSTLLADATATSLGLDPTTATPNDAFAALVEAQGGKMDAKIGDVMITTRTDLGDNWLLCNGSAIDGDEYTDLAEPLLNAALIKKATQSSTVAYNNSNPTRLVNLNGTYYGLAYSAVNAYVLDLSSNTCLFSMTAGTSYSSFHAVGAAYGAGYYVLVANDTYSNLFVAYQTGTTGSTSRKALSGGTNVSDIVYANGRFVVSGRSSSGYPCIWYATTPSGTWTQVILSSASTIISSNGGGVIRYMNNRFVAVWPKAYGIVIGYSSNGISWSTTEVTGSYTPNSSADYVDIAYSNGKYAVVSTVISSSKVMIFSSNNISTGWSEAKVVSSYAYYGFVGAVADKFVVITLSTNTYGTIQVLDTDTGEWEETYTGAIINNAASPYNGVVVDSGSIKVYSKNASYTYCYNWYAALPTISFDGAYAYIKAKEATA